jgi:hypothetical protein
MADSLATAMVRTALEARDIDEYVASLSYLLLVQTKFDSSSVLNEHEFQTLVGEMVSAGPRGATQAGSRFLAPRMRSTSSTGQVATDVVLVGLRLEAGAIPASAEAMKATYTIVRPESSQQLWWLAHAGCLGMCYWAARMGAQGEVPPAEVLDYVGQYAGFLMQASGHDALARVQGIVETFQLASSALYGAVEFRPGRSQTTREDRSGAEAEEMARLVDNLTGREWRFQEAVRDLHQRWTGLYMGTRRGGP